MAFDVSKLKTVEDCDTVLAKYNREKTLKEQDVVKIGFDLDDMVDREATDSLELVTVRDDLAQYQTALPGMPEGKAKRDLLYKLNQASFREQVLMRRLESVGGSAMITKQVDAENAQAEAAKYTTLIAEVSTRKAELEAAA